MFAHITKQFGLKNVNNLLLSLVTVLWNLGLTMLWNIVLIFQCFNLWCKIPFPASRVLRTKNCHIAIFMGCKPWEFGHYINSCCVKVVRLARLQQKVFSCPSFGRHACKAAVNKMYKTLGTEMWPWQACMLSFLMHLICLQFWELNQPVSKCESHSRFCPYATNTCMVFLL